MIRITNLPMRLGYTQAELLIKVKELLKTDRVDNVKTVRRAVDARRKNDVHYVLSVDISVENEEEILARGIKDVTKSPDARYKFEGRGRRGKPPIVVGSGPAGLFCALYLARAGHKPIVLERGADVDTRMREVERYWKGGGLNVNTNVQFGEGGAGTFSDGKLNTGIRDIRIAAVLEEFVRYGANPDILVNAKPHIGTDCLRGVVKAMREDIIRLGGEVRFNTQLVDIELDGGVRGAVVRSANGIEELDADCILLAIGHSARDTLEMLHKRGVNMIRKPFSVGARIEHTQEFISKSLYGAFADRLPPADYKLAVHLPSGRSLYTFCMCPGGYVVAAASERGGIVTNGMSYSDRSGKNANSAVLVGVTPEDFAGSDPLAGMRFQREIERRAYELCGGRGAPAQTVGDFMNKRKTTGFKGVMPTYRPGVEGASLDEVLPQFVCDTMREGLIEMDKRLHGFAAEDAVLTAPETRSSSPVRLVRDEGFELSVKGLFTAGEGGGYAGGITSAAVDGIRAAEMIDKKFGV